MNRFLSPCCPILLILTALALGGCSGSPRVASPAVPTATEQPAGNPAVPASEENATGQPPASPKAAGSDRPASYVAIMDFQILSNEESVQALSREVPQSLAGAFLAGGLIRPVERQELEKALSELELSVSDLADPDRALQVGRLLGAGYLLLGSVTKLGGNVKLNCRLIETETSQIVFSESSHGSFEKVFQVEEDLARKVEDYLRTGL